jgi:signal transduction histidine kinase/PAS domain-containing protein
VTRGAALRAARRADPRVEDRVRLLEFLLASEDSVALAQRSLEWLGDVAGVREGHCLALDADQTHLTYLAGYRVPRIDSFTVDLDAHGDPLIRVLSASAPVVLPDERTAALFDKVAPTLGVPLHGAEAHGDSPVGVLLIRPVTADKAELEWIAQYFGYRLGRARLRSSSLETERRLRRDRDLLQGVLDRVTDPILLTDTEGRMVLANAPAERLFAAREEESEGRRRAVAINNMLFSSALGRSAVEQVTPAARELALVDPTEGSDLLFELISTTAGDVHAGMGIVSILRNVSDLRRATEEIEANYQRLRAAEADVRAERDRLDLVIDSVADPILVTDPGGNVVLMNAPAERLFAVSDGASLAEIQRVQANDANFTSFVSNVLFGSGESPYQGGVNLVDPRTGDTIPVEAVSGKVYGERSEMSIVTILHDRREAIEREQLYEQLKTASAELERRVQEATSALVHQNELLRRQAIELEQASIAKSQFLANVSHDVRTPLNAILGYTSLLLRGVSGPIAPAQRDSLARVDANARHLLTLINEILDISRIEAGKMPLRLATIKLSELIVEIMTEVAPLIERSKLVVTAHVPRGLPLIRSDRQKVKQILLNLLTNALKFTPRGSVTVSCTFHRGSQEIAVAVADTGIGIAEADQTRIFEAFSQADLTPTRESGGTGLGLAICRRLATVLGGRITLESKLRQGSTFTLVLPAGLKRS